VAAPCGMVFPPSGGVSAGWLALMEAAIPRRTSRTSGDNVRFPISDNVFVARCGKPLM
jgi:hypothetical protein